MPTASVNDIYVYIFKIYSLYYKEIYTYSYITKYITSSHFFLFKSMILSAAMFSTVLRKIRYEQQHYCIAVNLILYTSAYM